MTFRMRAGVSCYSRMLTSCKAPWEGHSFCPSILHPLHSAQGLVLLHSAGGGSTVSLALQMLELECGGRELVSTRLAASELLRCRSTRETPIGQLSFPFLQVALFTCIVLTTLLVGRLANLLNKRLFKPCASKAVYGEGHKDVRP